MLVGFWGPDKPTLREPQAQNREIEATTSRKTIHPDGFEFEDHAAGDFVEDTSEHLQSCNPACLFTFSQIHCWSYQSYQQLDNFEAAG